MRKTLARPPKITKFLSHMFPTGRERLYFELVVTSFVPIYEIEPERIELEMPSNDYFVKYNLLRRYDVFNDSMTPGEINEKCFLSTSAIIVDMTNTNKTTEQQIDFINETYSIPIRNRNKSKSVICRDRNSYIFIVKNSLCKDNDHFKTFALTDYNDNDYEFTINEINEYTTYVITLYNVMSDICDKLDNCRIDDLIDYYINNYRPIPKKEPKKIKVRRLKEFCKQLNAANEETRNKMLEEYYQTLRPDYSYI